VTKVAVEVGLSDDTYQEIVSGLASGDEVVTGPDRVLRALEDGDRVAVGGGQANGNTAG
jgi:HlyD family secretion protein